LNDAEAEIVAGRNLSPSVYDAVIKAIRLEFPNFTSEKRLEAVNPTGADKTTELTEETNVLLLAQLQLTSERVVHKIDTCSADIALINEVHFMSHGV
jgi:hypothetical protein